MLRESSKHVEQDIDLKTIGTGNDPESDIPHDALLRQFADAVVQQDASAAAALRPELIAALGPEGFVDACAVVAAFHGFTRVADATGIEVEAMRAETAQFVETTLGIKKAPTVDAAQ